METREWRYVDKSSWGDGCWQDEPDKKQWVDEKTGLPCLVVRNPGGALCGYVGVSKSHPLYGVNYNAREHEDGHCDDGRDYCVHYRVNVDVHGGLTFSAKCSPREDKRGICHIVSPGENDDVWWLGFDCAHLGDVSPGWAALHPASFGEDGTYKSLRYVEMEVASLARQLDAGGSAK